MHDRIQIEPQADGKFCLYDSWQFSKLCDFTTRYDAQVVADGINAGDTQRLDAEYERDELKDALVEADKSVEAAEQERDDALDRLEDMEAWFEDADPAGAMCRKLEELEREREQIRAVMPDLLRDAELWRKHRAKLDKARDKRRNRKECDRLIASIQQHARKETHHENPMA